MNTATLVVMLKAAVDGWYEKNTQYIEGPLDSYLMEELREAMLNTVMEWGNLSKAAQG